MKIKKKIKKKKRNKYNCINRNNDYSEKIKNYRKNLDKIVNKLNESNLGFTSIFELLCISV